MPLLKPRIRTIPLLICICLSFQSYAAGNQSAQLNNPSAPSGNPSAQLGNSITRLDTLPAECPKTPEIEKIIAEAISLGAPLYNEGLHLACYRIYEWAGYKILYEYGKTCKEAERILKTAIEKSHGDYSDTEKAWLMRAAFDKIIGEPTQMVEPKKAEPLRKG